MRKIFPPAVWGLMLLLFTASCGEDRSGEYYELTEENQWIYGTMSQYYLWYDAMYAPSRNDFFAEPEKFFDKLLPDSDKYSFFESMETVQNRSIDHNSTYGFDFVLYTNPLGNNTDVYARVLFVLPGSPAWDAGLVRGDWIESIGGIAITKNNYGYLMQGDATTLQTIRLAVDGTGEEYVWVKGDTLNMAASHPMEMYPFYVDTIYQIEDKKIAYLFYDRFTPGPDYESDETQYVTEMNAIFARYKRNGVTDLILDLRYNPGGYLSCAQQLASLIVPDNYFGRTFCSLIFNNKNESRNASYPYDESLTGGSNLSLGRFYVITSEYTASASEAVIYDMRATMGNENVITVGSTTEGKNVASIPFEREGYSFVLHPIVATIYDADGTSDYADGIAPTHRLEELSYLDDLRPLGDTRELLLAGTLYLIANGQMQEAPQAARHIPAFRYGPSSVSEKRQQTLIHLR